MVLDEYDHVQKNPRHGKLKQLLDQRVPHFYQQNQSADYNIYIDGTHIISTTMIFWAMHDNGIEM